MLLFAVLLARMAIASVTIAPLYWNTTNPIFTNMGKYAEMTVRVGEKIDIYCPQQGSARQNDEPLYLKVWLVKEDGFHGCKTNGNDRKVLTCNNPLREKKFTLLFQEVNPNPFGLEFQKGENYYLISTADGTPNGLDHLSGGVCQEYRMKMKIRVKPDIAGDGEFVSALAAPILDQKGLLRDMWVSFDTEPGSNNLALEAEEIELEAAVASTGFTIGIVIGAFTVLILIIAGVVGYRWQARRGDIRKALYIPRPRPSSTSQVHLTLVPAGTTYPYESARQLTTHTHANGRPISGMIGGGSNGGATYMRTGPHTAHAMLGGPTPNYKFAPPTTKNGHHQHQKDSPSGTYSSRQDSLGETSCGSELTYLEPNQGGVVEV